MDWAQFISSRAAEFGIQQKYLDGELYLVNDALAGGLRKVPKFKIGRSVILAVTVFVVDVFTLSQRSAKYLCHYKAVLKFFFAAPQIHAHVTSRMNVPFRVNRAPSSAVVSASHRAKALVSLPAFESSVLPDGGTVVRSFAAALALKCRWIFAVHSHWLQTSTRFVKENV